MEFPDRATVAELIDPIELPTFVRIRYEPAAERVESPGDRARAELDRLSFSAVDRGGTVAVAVGSRGIDAIDEVVAGVVSGLHDRGFEPILVPAMGSHGGATADGQREVLASLGITPDRVDAPIDARMTVDSIGSVTVGGQEMPVYVSTAAAAADAIVVINRVKAHTNFTGRIESGLTKMAVVGLGKQRGAKAFHSTAIAAGYVETLDAAFEQIQEHTPIVGGIALVENFYEELAVVEGIPTAAFRDREPELLTEANEAMATLPVDSLDLLVVDELGKDISGAGMDTNVIGRYRVLNAPDPQTPDIDLIYARGLTDGTEGNGIGIGLADVTRRAAVEELSLQKTYTNAITSGSLSKASVPLVAPDDELALAVACSALGGYDPETVRIAWIESTAELSDMWVSEALLGALPDGATVIEKATLSFENGAAIFKSI